MRHILRLTSSALFAILISCTPVPAQEVDPFKPGDDDVPDSLTIPKPGVGIFYNPCMTGQAFAEVIHRVREVPLMRLNSQQHGEQASVQIFVNDDAKTYTIAIMNTVLPMSHPQKICILANGTGYKYLKELGISI